jgi:preprotein translocase subunit YajC
LSSLILLLAMFVLLWVLLIRPQRQRQQKQQNLLSSVEPGDEVLTVGGLYGIVRDIDEEDDLIVEIAEGIQVRIARRAIGGVVKPEDEEDEELDEVEEDAIDAPEAVEDEGRVVLSEDSVSEEAPEDTAALDRR